MNFAHAHGTHVALPPQPLFEVKWPWDPTLLLFIALGFFYVRGLRAYRGKAPVARWQKIFFFVGLVVLLLAYLPPIDPLADQLFSAHMAQHMLITSVGVPLMIFGAPFFIFVRALPRSFRRRFFVPVAQASWLRAGLGVLRRPLAAVLLYEAVFWFWHIPRFYNKALLNDEIHLVEHACMALAAMNLWNLIIAPAPVKSLVAPSLRMLLLGFIMTADTALSAALSYSNKVWYAYDRLPMPAWWLWDRLDDQRFGGIVMWVAGGLVWLFAIIVLFFNWAKREQAMESNLNPAASYSILNP
jgi:putative membrane protein